MKPTGTKPTIKRRRVISTIGTAGLALGGLSTSVTANENGRANGSASENRGGKIPLVDGSVDLLVYWSSGDDPNDFGYPTVQSTSDRGLFFPGHDPKDGGLLNYERFELSPNGNTLHNDFELFQGALNAGKPKPYTLIHQGDGVFESRGQVLKFDALPYKKTVFNDLIPKGDDDGLEDEAVSENPVEILAGKSWRAVGTDIAKLRTDDEGIPIQVGEWGVTRVDVYSHGQGKPKYELSLLYLIWGNKRPNLEFPGGLLEKLTQNREAFARELIDGIPDEAGRVAQELIDAGQLNMGGRPRGR